MALPKRACPLVYWRIKERRKEVRKAQGLKEERVTQKERRAKEERGQEKEEIR